MPIIGIIGRIGSGKDTIAQMIIDESAKEHGWEIKKFAGKLKEIVALLTGCKVQDLENEQFKNSDLPEQWAKYRLLDFMRDTGTVYPDVTSSEVYAPKSNSQHVYTVRREIMTYRKLLQVLGTEALRDLIHPNVHVNALMSQYHPNLSSWIVTDVRFPNEGDAIKNAGGWLVKAERPGISHGTHPSETSMDDYKSIDFTIRNIGDLVYLRRGVNEVYSEIKKHL